MEETSIEANAGDSEWSSICIGGGTKIDSIEVDFDGIYKEWLENSRKATNEYHQESDSPWASPDYVRPLRWLEQRATCSDGQGLSGQPGQENAGLSIGQHSLVFEQPKLGERTSAVARQKMEICRKSSPLIR